MNISAQANQSVRWTSALSVWQLVIGLVQVVILADFFSPAQFGVVALLMLVIAISDVFVRVGFSDAVIANRELTSPQLSTLFWLNIIVALLVYGAILLAADFFASFIDGENTAALIRAIAFTLVVGACSVQFEALCRKRLEFRLLALLGIFRSGLALFVLWIGLVVGWSLWAYVASILASQLVYTLSLLFYARRRDWLPGAELSMAGVSGLLQFGAYRIGAAFLNNVSNRVDQFAILAFLGASPLGIYVMAHSIAMKPFQKISPILSRVSFPVFASVAEDNATLIRGYRKGVRMILFVNAPMLLGYIAVAPSLIPLYLGAQWEPAVAVSQVLAIYALLRSAASINIGLILAKGKFRWPLYWNLAMCCVLPLVVFLAAQRQASILDIAIALTVLQLGIFCLSYYLFPRALLGPFGREYLVDVVAPVGASVVMYGAVVALAPHLVSLAPTLQLVTLIASGVLVYGVVSLVLQRTNLRDALAVALPSRQPVD